MSGPTFYPPYKEIENMTTKPTEGEKCLLDFLYNTLDEKCDVIFQPSLNGMNPDIAIIRKNGGIIIIEVKDWHLDSYEYIDKHSWSVRKINQKIKSPFAQVNAYKNELFDAYLHNINVERFIQTKYYAIVQTIVYFHNATHNELKAFLKDSTEVFLGKDDLTIDKFKRAFSDNGKYFFDKSKLFTDELYKEAKQALCPTEDQPYKNPVENYSEIQTKIINSAKTRKRLGIKGAAGSGKSQVLAKIALNKAEEHPGSKILFLSYNITLPNFIRLLIRKAKLEINYKSKAFTLSYYHKFIKNACNDLGMPAFEDLKYYDLDLSEKIKQSIKQNLAHKTDCILYDLIIIDEVQDFKTNWQKNILSFLAPNGSVVYCGDIKQNIYNEQLEIFSDDKYKIKWFEMNQSYRTPTKITDLANSFSKEFLKNTINIEPRQITLFHEQEPHIKYYELSTYDYGFIWKKIQEYKNFVKEYNNEHEIVILGENVLRLRHLAKFIQDNHESKTGTHRYNFATTFESQENFISLCKSCLKNYNGNNESMKKAHELFQIECEKTPRLKTLNFDRLSEDDERKCEQCMHQVLYEIRKSKKFAFHMYNSSFKFSTIHSFKGWELKNVFLILDSDFEESAEHESEDNLVYTALTRAKTNLIIINIGNKKYKKFFQENIEHQR